MHIHGALSAGECSTCHESDQGEHVYPLKREGNATCEECHTVIGEREHLHAAVEDGCVSCHDPHVSSTRFLLKVPSMEVLCVGCHPVRNLPHRHGPFRAGECLACHEPHESEYAMLLRGGEGPEHCFMCHEETRHALDTALHVHDPAAADCNVCHDPHESEHPHALKASPEEMCLSCHDAARREIDAAAHAHGAILTEHRCGNCHDAHVSDRSALMRDREDQLCLRCHDRELLASNGRTLTDMRTLTEERRYLHGPLRSGECSPCHDAHGALYPQLLRQSFTEAFYQPFDLDSYALCFDCHESQLVLTPETTSLTGFRNGSRNLHYLHVNRDRKGRTCRTCHEIHGSDLPMHIASSVPFEGSGWSMAIGFRKTEDGGSCAPGCHGPHSYTRSNSSSADDAPTGGAQ
jgi:predicted CXXCH cytochrome family protein